ncbi:MAG: extensin family protein [Pseudomonadota bacterium]
MRLIPAFCRPALTVLLLPMLWMVTSAGEANETTPPNPVVPPVAAVGPALETPPNPIARPQLATRSAPQATPTQPAAASSCAAALQSAGVLFETVGRHPGDGVCGIEDAVRVRSIGPVTLSPSALLACPTALAFSDFLADTLIPEAQSAFGSPPSTVHVAASYVCRTRNHVEGARVSEHGFGRAIDVRAITMTDGYQWTVQPQPGDATSGDARFQAAYREAACGPFKTVLGPGSDGFHQDHIHIDNAQRSSTYCR